MEIYVRWLAAVSYKRSLAAKISVDKACVPDVQATQEKGKSLNMGDYFASLKTAIRFGVHQTACAR